MFKNIKRRLNFSYRVALFIFAIIFVITPAYLIASTVTDAYDQPSSLSAGAGSNHEFVFVVADNIDDGESFVIDFPSEYDLSAIIEDDIDLEVAGSEITTAPDCSGIESIAVTNSSNSLTFTVCVGDHGSIASGQRVEVEVGLNASSSGVGAHRIVNPSTTGTFFIGLSGDSGIEGSIPIPIISNSSESVSATVPTSSGSSSGGGDSGDDGDDEERTITLLWPNGGEDIQPTDTYSILWENTGDISFVDLLLSENNGDSYTVIVQDLPNNGSYTWTVPDAITQEALIQIRGTDLVSLLAYDVSNEVFSIGIVEEECVEETWYLDSDGDGYGDLENTVDACEQPDGYVDNSDDCDDSDSDINEICEEEECVEEIWYLDADGDGYGNAENPLNACEQQDGYVANSNDCDDSNSEVYSNCEVDSEEPDPIVTPPVDPDSEVSLPSSPIIPEEIVEREIITEISVGSGQIVLEEKANSVFLLPSKTISLSITPEDIEEVEKIQVLIDGEIYSVEKSEEGSYSVDVPTSLSDSSVNIVVDYLDGHTQTEVRKMHIQGYGRVVEIDDSEEERPVENATVFVFRVSDGERVQWPAGNFDQFNPVISREDGSIGWYVPNGTYIVTAAKSGYEDAEEMMFVSNNILSPKIVMEIEVEDEIEEVITDIDEEPKENDEEEVTQNMVVSALAPVFEVSDKVQETIANIREIPEVQVAADVAIPVAAIGATASTVVLASSFSLFPWLQYLFSAPILLLARRRRESFGIVYNSMTKVPVDLAIVRLKNMAGKLVRTMVTDPEGRYYFKVDPGEYKIEIKKIGFNFPSKYIEGSSSDGAFLDVYTGGKIVVSEDNVVIAANIPVDPADSSNLHKPKTLIFKRFLRVFQQIMAVSGILVSVFVVIISPSIITWLLLGAQFIVYGVTRAIAKPKKRKGWGVVADKNTKKAVSNTVVRLFEPKYNKLIETTITDHKGRYAFLAGPNTYYVTFEKPGFEKKEVRPIDYTKKKEPTAISVDVNMNPILA